MKTILVIEDNTEVRENLCEILDLAGYNTISAENGKIGVQKTKESKPNLILCDVMMPELDGFGVLRILNRDSNLMNIPFMFLTAKAEKTDFRKGMGLGADDYITKPFDEVELLDAIEIRLKKSEQLATITNTDEGIRTFFSEAKAQEALKELSEDRERRIFEKKSTVFESGQYPKYLYYVNYGQIKTSQLAESGKELITQLYGPGDFVGLVALLENQPYTSTAISNEKTELLLIPSEDFRLLMFNNRDFSTKFIQLLAHHVSATESQLIDYAFSSVRKKVSKALIKLSTIKEGGNISVSREDLAAMAGTARETVIRTLSDFKAEGLIDIKDHKIIIVQREKLEHLPQ